ncbi:hypothetical protein ABZ769_18300 [Streptomyces olivoreticuli]
MRTEQAARRPRPGPLTTAFLAVLATRTRAVPAHVRRLLGAGTARGRRTVPPSVRRSPR